MASPPRARICDLPNEVLVTIFSHLPNEVLVTIFSHLPNEVLVTIFSHLPKEVLVTIFSHLPNKVLVTIFSHLPVADMARCAAACEHCRWIVTRFTLPWRGKTYTSCRSPSECTDTLAILHALPPLREVVIESANAFMMNVSYPRIVLSLKYVRVLQDFPKLRCKVLMTRVDIAGDILSYHSVIDFEGLQQLRIMRTSTEGFLSPQKYSANYVVRTALNLCSSLRHVSICTSSISEENLDAVEGLSCLKSLEMSCTRFQKLSFLRHCSVALEHLRLLNCTRLPSRELRELRQLRCLRSLRLSGYLLQEGDLVAAVVGLANLERLHLERCYSVRDLSFVQQCGRLTELRITNSFMKDPLEMAEEEDLALAELWIPKCAAFRNVQVVGVTGTAVDLPDALTQLEELGLARECLAYLGTLRNCSQLRQLVCDFVRWLPLWHILNVRIDVSLASSAQS